MLNQSDFSLDFKVPLLSDYEKFKSFLSLYTENALSCEINPITLFLWKDYYKQEIAFFEDLAFIKLGREEKVFLLPFGKDIKKGVTILKEYCKKENIPLCFLAAEGERLDAFNSIFSEEFSQTESRDDFEYLYLSEKLINLSGKAFHSKRNHISAFTKKNDWCYKSLSQEILPDIFKMSDEWLSLASDNPEQTSLISENKAIKELLPNFEALGIKGGGIYVDGKLIAFTFGSKINDKVFDVQVEKALPQFRSAYTLINNQFVKNELSSFKYINREDDMGIEGLRKAKLSYHPEILLKKYIIEEV